MAYTHSISVPQPYPRTVELVRSALAEQGFGILSEIDVRATFGAKLGPDAATELGDYLILGACNPQLASRALAAEPELGALLPCNVVVRRKPADDATTVEAIDPQTMVQLSGSPAVRDVSQDADAQLRAALSAVEAGGGAGTPS
ncbi:DUF302 domain-containing protein [Sinomonas albida]|uniref:DUF302 domain-containing protein n=1 Tax=Sinomonas albida TaxID=369942 RepID=UPI0010A84708|nr:DUF302 domain-containing protein [Sinomonas albida]